MLHGLFIGFLGLLVISLMIATVYGGGNAMMKAQSAQAVQQLIKEGKQVAFAVQLAEQDLLAGNKPVKLSKLDLIPAYLPALPAAYATLEANPLSTLGSSAEFDFSKGNRVFTNGATVTPVACDMINQKSGIRAKDTVSVSDSDDDLTVSLAADSGKLPYGCDTTKHVVFYTF